MHPIHALVGWCLKLVCVSCCVCLSLITCWHAEVFLHLIAVALFCSWSVWGSFLTQQAVDRREHLLTNKCSTFSVAVKWHHGMPLQILKPNYPFVVFAQVHHLLWIVVPQNSFQRWSGGWFVSVWLWQWRLLLRFCLPPTVTHFSKTLTKLFLVDVNSQKSLNQQIKIIKSSPFLGKLSGCLAAECSTLSTS